MSKPFLRTFWRTGVKGLCPNCGKTSMFSGYIEMRERCANCQLRYQTSAGAWLGALALGYTIGAAVAIVLTLVEIGYRPMRDAGLDPAWTIVIIALVGTAVGYRWAKSFWFSLLYLYDFMAIGDVPPGPPPVSERHVGRVREP
ncbi:MAG: DUF983 domain-containing protein [Dehalococcoidia bacterium]|nr:DUF983 domain-containing protein [Dehalococcoidia bacterium]